jgi:hypothetical protein
MANLGLNDGSAAGQTMPQLHFHVIPRYTGDVPDPRGGIRHIIPCKARYLFSVAQVSKPAVSRVSKPACRWESPPTWKSATRQVWKPALRGGAPGALNRYQRGRGCRRRERGWFMGSKRELVRGILSGFSVSAFPLPTPPTVTASCPQSPCHSSRPIV